MRLALFDLDGTLVDRTAAFADAIAVLSSDHSYGPEIEQWLLSELADRAERHDFVRLREAFNLDEDPDHLWRIYIDRMATAVTCRPEVLEALSRLKEAGWRIGVATTDFGLSG